jgi:hypothetical protein
MSTWWIFDDRERDVGSIDHTNLTHPDPLYFVGATIWGEWRGNMGTLHRSPCTGYDPEKHAIQGHNGSKGNRYFLEDLPQFLDQPGEYYYQTDGPHAGRMYLRLEGDRNPNRCVVEVARVRRLVEIRHQSDIVISGLRFSFNNFLDHNERHGWPVTSLRPCAVAIIGDCQRVWIKNCTFSYCSHAVLGFARSSEFWTRMYAPPLMGGPEFDNWDEITISDNQMMYIDDSAILVEDGYGAANYTGPSRGEIGRLSILRNNLFDVAGRQVGKVWSPAASIKIVSSTLLECAGNMLQRCWGAGVFIPAIGKGGGDPRSRPLIRVLIHHNRVEDSLLASNDWGGIEPWQGGPCYTFNNVSINAVGPKHNVAASFEPTDAVFVDWSSNAYNYYLDGAYKQYLFNNIAWGKHNDPQQFIKNRAGGMMVLGFLNNWWNNTFYKFTIGMSGSSGQRGIVGGNVFQNISRRAFNQDVRGDLSLAGGGVGGAQMEKLRKLTTLAYVSNVFHDCKSIGIMGRDTIEAAREGLAGEKAMVSQVGYEEKEALLADPEKMDFRPIPGCEAIDRGVRFFVPWGLCGTVGEWSFTRFNAEPQVVIGENFHMTDEYVERHMYFDIPRNDLHVPGATAGDYVPGLLEDWTDGALVFDGKERYAVLQHERVTADYTVSKRFVEEEDYPRVKVESGTFTYPGEKRRTVDMDANSFLIEIVLRADPGKGGTLVSKTDGEIGYSLKLLPDGSLAFDLATGSGRAGITSGGACNDGDWHHVIAEADRTGGRLRVYVDGSLAADSPCDAGEGSLSNTADFLVGKGRDGDYFAGAIDFLRVCRGTLADARTTIDELYEWEFNGPFLRDFAGKDPVGKRDAGALELAL